MGSEDKKRLLLFAFFLSLLVLLVGNDNDDDQRDYRQFGPAMQANRGSVLQVLYLTNY